MEKFFAALAGTAGFAYIALIIAGLIGWIMNIITLVQTADGGLTTMFVLRIVGVFVAPLGGVLGYF